MANTASQENERPGALTKSPTSTLSSQLTALMNIILAYGKPILYFLL
jgi:hypothetical protein